MQLRLNPDQLDDAAISALKDKIAKSGIYALSLAVDGNHIDPDPARREKQNSYTLKCLDLCGKLGIPGDWRIVRHDPDDAVCSSRSTKIVKVYTEK